ncbi:hypothetical protein F5Y10DRAFT_262831 [Nemania abortiva]|nr:hypothetical protein F5Y10DRAFT_262831 [Nemania abortiva]
MSPTSNDRSNENALCLLSLDGGGVRGLSSLLILKKLMESLDFTNPPRPCECFDMIGGTSTGGLIAIMLGRLRMTVDECIEMYKQLSPKIFTKIHHSKVNWRGELQSRFDHQALEKEIQLLLERHSLGPDELFAETPNRPECKTFVCATSRSSSETTVFSSYYSNRRGNDLRSVAKIYEVARATSAASSFFDPIIIGGEEFVDGATGANNPIQQMWTEATDTFRNGLDWILEDNVGCLVSIGTGKLPLAAFDHSLMKIANTLVAIATNSEQIADTFRKHHSRLYREGRAFRFNVDRGLATIGLEEESKMDDIQAFTRRYIQMEETFSSITACAEKLGELMNKIFEMLDRGSAHVWGNTSYEDRLVALRHTSSYSAWMQQGGVLYFSTPQYHSNKSPFKDFGASMLRFLYEAPKISLSGQSNSTCPTDSVDIHFYLYFQCDTYEKPGVHEGGRVNKKSLTGIDSSAMIREIGCQLCQYLLNENTISSSVRFTEAVQGSGLQLRDVIRLLQSGCHDTFFRLASTAIRLGLCKSIIFAIDAVHLIPDRYMKEGLYDRLLELCQKYPLSSRIILSGGRGHDLGVLESITKLLEHDTEYRECLGSLYFERQHTRREEIADPEPGTSEWIWSHKSYLSWTKVQRGILWIQGKPGSGKSVLAKSIIQRVHEMSDTQKTLICDWFYSTRGGEALMAHKSLLQSLLYQLLSQSPDLFRYFRDIYRQHPAMSKDWATVDLLLKILKTIATDGTKVIAVIDAMDESEDAEIAERQRKLVLSHFSEFVSEISGSRMKLLVLSRPTPDIESHFWDHYYHHQNLSYIIFERENSEDIKKIIQSGMASLRKAMYPLAYHSLNKRNQTRRSGETAQQKRTRERDEKEYQNMMSYLEENAGGVILWVTLILSILKMEVQSGAYTYERLHEKMRQLPRDLESLYVSLIQDLMSKLSDHEQQMARTALLWVSGANTFHSLSVIQLREALAIPKDPISALLENDDPIDKYCIPVYDWADFRYRLRKLCGPLIEIIHPTTSFVISLEKGEPSPTETGQTVLNESAQLGGALDNVLPSDRVQLLHRTVKDFLADPGAAGYFSFTASEAIEKVQEDCQKYVAIVLPQYATAYAPCPPHENIHWTETAAGVMNYAENRVLLSFIMLAFPKDALTEKIIHSLVDQTIRPSWKTDRTVIGELRNSPLLKGHTTFYSELDRRHSQCQQVVCAELLRVGCSKGLTHALETILLAMERMEEWGVDLDFADYIAQVLVMSAIENDLLSEARSLMAQIHKNHVPRWSVQTRAFEFLSVLNSCELAAVQVGDENLAGMIFDAIDACLRPREKDQRHKKEIVLNAARRRKNELLSCVLQNVDRPLKEGVKSAIRLVFASSVVRGSLLGHSRVVGRKEPNDEDKQKDNGTSSRKRSNIGRLVCTSAACEKLSTTT